MAKESNSNQINVNGDMIGGVISTGNNNSNNVSTGDININSNNQIGNIPQPEQVDMSSELAAIREALADLDTEFRTKIDNALEELQEEIERDEPDKEEAGRSLERALEYSAKSEAFGNVVDTIKPHLTNAAGWLGKNWLKILTYVGLTV